jgi:RNA recognition motif-containing protein
MTQDRKVFVGGVPQNLNQDDLYAIFSEYAGVKKAWLQNCRENHGCPQNHRGFGFVIFHDSTAIEGLLGNNPSRFVLLRSGAKIEVKRALSSNKLSSHNEALPRQEQKSEKLNDRNFVSMLCSVNRENEYKENELDEPKRSGPASWPRQQQRRRNGTKKTRQDDEPSAEPNRVAEKAIAEPVYVSPVSEYPWSSPRTVTPVTIPRDDHFAMFGPETPRNDPFSLSRRALCTPVAPAPGLLQAELNTFLFEASSEIHSSSAVAQRREWLGHVIW